jgi:hypothetical protein
MEISDREGLVGGFGEFHSGEAKSIENNSKININKI